MCRRMSLAADLREVTDYFQIDQVMFHYKLRYNISPTQNMPVIVMQNGERLLDDFRWGLVPYWGKDAVNAELDRVHVNPAYHHMIGRQRCVIPCNGLYYWRKVGKRTYPMRVITSNQSLFGIAGLYEIWRDARGEPIRTCSLVMTDTNTLIREFGTRMPAFLSPEEMNIWLDHDITDMRILRSLLRPYPDAWMHAYPVSPVIDNDLYDNSECIQEMNLKTAWVKN
ncbi:SOS response-associated peptidase [Paenibacillus sediminis]|uniref:Abasic site processing protein n=1 Tax=Paenibacillus sediminis TaxID=664909 RepID=A0ABS4H0D6_9BACL|nr:SOS response-associated peptidase [Paenibacillus sediminis]MBP1935974.1 putative SOS response-associated peptidase YedK [Paenibacillus sediminis]